MESFVAFYRKVGFEVATRTSRVADMMCEKVAKVRFAPGLLTDSGLVFPVTPTVLSYETVTC